MPFYRKNPVVIEAMEFTEESKLKVFDWMTCKKYAKTGKTGQPELVIETLEGNMIARVGDFIIKGIKGEFYPCNPGIFHETYLCLRFDGSEGPDT